MMQHSGVKHKSFDGSVRTVYGDHSEDVYSVVSALKAKPFALEIFRCSFSPSICF